MQIGDKIRVVRGRYFNDLKGLVGTIVAKGHYTDWHAIFPAMTEAVTLYNNEIELEGPMSKPKVNEATVKAVGGCQQDALRALVEEMGYEIVAAAKPAAKPETIVRPGDRVKHQTAGMATVISVAALRRRPGGAGFVGSHEVPFVKDSTGKTFVGLLESTTINGITATKFEDD